jgi:hypothetical protein
MVPNCKRRKRLGVESKACVRTSLNVRAIPELSIRAGS